MSPVISPPLGGISTLLFDVGNTLHHLDHGFIADSVSRHGHPVNASQVAAAELVAKRAIDEAFRARAAGSDSTRQVAYFETILETLGVAAAQADVVLAELRAENLRSSLWRVMHPETPGLFAELRRRGFTLGVVSNADGRVAAALAATGLQPHLRAIIDSHVVGVEKPDARIFELGLQACGAAPQAAAYIGDIYEIDVRGARNAGMTAIVLDPLGAYVGADCIRIESLAELLDLFLACS